MRGEVLWQMFKLYMANYSVRPNPVVAGNLLVPVSR